MYIFLDFDGVTHPLGKSDFSSISPLINILDQYQDAKIILSTQWREHTSLEILKTNFPPQIQERIVGQTPILGQNIPYHRFYEILTYNKKHNIEKNQWVALDDNDCLFPQYCKNLILIKDGKGFNEYYADILKEHLNKISSNLIKKQKNIIK